MVVFALPHKFTQDKYRESLFVGQISIVVVSASMVITVAQHAHNLRHFMRNIGDIAMSALTGLEVLAIRNQKFIFQCPAIDKVKAAISQFAFRIAGRADVNASFPKVLVSISIRFAEFLP